MTHRTVGIVSWGVLCAAILWGALVSRDVFVTAAVIIPVLLLGTRALFGRPSRTWQISFLVFAVLLALMAGKSVVAHREISFREIAVFVLLAVAYLQLDRERARIALESLPGRIRAALDVPFRQAATVILVNIVVVACLLMVSEGLARLLLPNLDPARATDTKFGNPFWFQFQPFLMFSMDANVDIQFKNGRLPGDVEIGRLQTNNMGFRMKDPVRFDTVRRKAPDERVVLFTGGSAAWGAGATSNETTIADRLQSILNESQSKYRYVVISLSSGGWIAMQSVLAVAIYGLNFDPDWVVGMDGNNDIVAACAEGYGAGRDGFSNEFDKYFRSYLYHHPAPSFYRGSWENELIRVSMLYRILTRKRHVPEPFKFSAKWDEVERSLVFYELAYDRLLRLFASSKVKVLISSQPYKNLFRKDFEAGPEKLRELAQRYAGTDCRRVPHLELMKYFHPRLTEVSRNLVARWKDRADVRYLNMTEYIPEDPKTRLDFSWGGSPVHLSDRGQDFLARIYARTILDADLPGHKREK